MGRLDERGQSTVELALCLPFVALVLAAVVEVGGLAADQVRLLHGAREAARVAVVDDDEDRVRAAAERSGLRGLGMDLSPAPIDRRQGEPLTVRLTYHPRGRVPVVGRLFEAMELRAAATMRIEQP